MPVTKIHDTKNLKRVVGSNFHRFLFIPSGSLDAGLMMWSVMVLGACGKGACLPNDKQESLSMRRRRELHTTFKVTCPVSSNLVLIPTVATTSLSWSNELRTLHIVHGCIRGILYGRSWNGLPVLHNVCCLT